MSEKRGKKKKPEAQPRRFNPRWLPWILGGVAFLFFLPGAWYGFINMDDLPLIAGNPLVKNGSLLDLGWIFKKGIFTPHYKPLVYWSWILEKSIFGINAHVIHFNNALLHGINTGLVFLLSLKILPKMWPGMSRYTAVAVLCALGWGLHPFRIESVTWAVERKDVLFGLFYLLACLNYVRYISDDRNRKYLILATVFYLMSCLSKSMGVTFFATAILMEFLFAEGKRPAMKNLLGLVPLGVVLTTALYLQGFIFPPDVQMSQSRVVNAAQQNVYVPESVGSSSPALQFASIANMRMVGFAAHTLLPVKSAIVYPREQWLDTIGSGIYYLFAIPLVFLALLVLRKPLRKNLGFGLFWFVITLSPILVAEGTGTNFLSDRYTYMPSLGLIWFVIPGLIKLLPQQVKGVITVGHLAAGLVVLALAGMTLSGIRHWRTSLALWEHLIRHYPVNWYGYYNRAKLISDEDPQQALADLNKAIDYLPNQSIVLFARGTIFMEQGNREAAIEDFSQAIYYDNDHIESWINRGLCYKELKQYQKAVDDLTYASTVPAYKSKALNNRALAFSESGNRQAALADLNQVISEDPSYSNAYLNRANIFIQADIARWQDAIEDYNVFLTANPNADNALFRRAYAHAQLGQHDKALPDYDRVIELVPGQGFYFYGRAQSYEALGRNAEALADFQRATQLGVQVDPERMQRLR